MGIRSLGRSASALGGPPSFASTRGQLFDHFMSRLQLHTAHARVEERNMDYPRNTTDPVERHARQRRRQKTVHEGVLVLGRQSE